MVLELNEVFAITINDPALVKTIDLPFLDKAGFDQWDLDRFTRFNSEIVTEALDLRSDLSSLPKTSLEPLLPGYDSRQKLLKVSLQGSLTLILWLLVLPLLQHHSLKLLFPIDPESSTGPVHP